MAKFDRVVVTCEHGGNRVLPKYRKAFEGRDALLNSHRGWDAGALETARRIADALDAPLHTNTMTRLIVDFNRTVGNPDLFTEISGGFDEEEKRELLEKYYTPYRGEVEERIAEWVGTGKTVLHLSIHSFTPVKDGQVRNADVGLLYDPARRIEAEFCAEWQRSIEILLPGVPVRRNYPYAGTDDGFTRWLRTLFPAKAYAGIELELNHRDYFADAAAWKKLRDGTIAALQDVLRPPDATLA